MDPYNRVAQCGFAILENLFSSAYMDQLSLVADGTTPTRSRAGVRHALRFQPFAATAADPVLIGVARDLLGPSAFPFRATLFDKSQASNWLVVWHQDTALPLRERIELPGWGPWSLKDGINYAHAPANTLAQILALRLQLDDSTAENGPLKVLPGTHQQGVLSDDSIHEMAKRIPARDCVVSRGGVVAMWPLLVHASSKSRSEMPRRVLHIEYAASPSIANPLQLAVC